MKKISVLYWTGTGNTQIMAEMIAKGIQEAGGEVLLKNVNDAGESDALDAELCVLGCPSMGDEILEEEEFEPFLAGIEGKMSGKKVALFGSYGWGDGQWMRDWHERMAKNGVVFAADDLIVNETPEGESEEACIQFGKKLAG